VNGGSNGAAFPTKTDSRAAAIAVALGSVVVIASQIPNQPLYFADESNVPRSEDAIIAYSFDKFLKTGDEEWPVLLPMT
jgi:PhoPQ-activated pathogenicity-related protein